MTTGGFELRAPIYEQWALRKIRPPFKHNIAVIHGLCDMSDRTGDNRDDATIAYLLRELRIADYQNHYNMLKISQLGPDYDRYYDPLGQLKR